MPPPLHARRKKRSKKINLSQAQQNSHDARPQLLLVNFSNIFCTGDGEGILQRGFSSTRLGGFLLMGGSQILISFLSATIDSYLSKAALCSMFSIASTVGGGGWRGDLVP